MPRKWEELETNFPSRVPQLEKYKWHNKILLNSFICHCIRLISWSFWCQNFHPFPFHSLNCQSKSILPLHPPPRCHCQSLLCISSTSAWCLIWALLLSSSPVLVLRRRSSVLWAWRRGIGGSGDTPTPWEFVSFRHSFKFKSLTIRWIQGAKV